MNEYHIGQTVIPYEIEWSGDRSTISLAMDTSMELTVKAPFDATHDDVEDVLDDKRRWLLETLYGLAEQADPPLDKEFLSGEKLRYNGRRYRLEVRDGDVREPTLDFDGHRFELTTPEARDVSVQRKRQTAVDWYVRTARTELPERVAEYAPKLGASDVAVEVRELHQRWGEYDDGQIRLHWRLLLAPRRIQDYVVAHELAHAEHDQHSDAFWNTVGTLVPDYEDRREWLRVNGNKMTV